MLTLSAASPELLGWALVSLVCLPLPISFLMARRRSARGRARRRREALSAVTTTDPLALLGFVDRSGPPVFDVERIVPVREIDRHLSDQEIETLATVVGMVDPNMRWTTRTPTADEVEDWLRSNTP